MESVAPISDLITGTVLYNKLVEDIVTEEAALTLTEYRILFFLCEAGEGRARIRDLAEALILSSSTISDAAKTLEGAGLVCKAARANDLKAVWAEVTPKGREAFEHACATICRETEEYWAVLGSEVSESYFAFGARLLGAWDLPPEKILALPGPVYYSFVSRRYLLSYTSWFKSTYNLSLLDVRVLLLIYERSKPLTCSETAHLLKVSNSSISAAVRRLSRVHHYLSRTSEASEHAVEIELTEEGAATAEEVYQRFVRFNLEQFELTREEFDAMLRSVQPRRRKSYLQKVFGESFANA